MQQELQLKKVSVPGGGVAFIRAIEALEKFKGSNEDETTGAAIVRRALEEPLRQIVVNAGYRRFYRSSESKRR
jgi:chaperonin GroEL (HSP60 family)